MCGSPPRLILGRTTRNSVLLDESTKRVSILQPQRDPSPFSHATAVSQHLTNTLRGGLLLGRLRRAGRLHPMLLHQPSELVSTRKSKLTPCTLLHPIATVQRIHKALAGRSRRPWLCRLLSSGRRRGPRVRCCPCRRGSLRCNWNQHLLRLGGQVQGAAPTATCRHPQHALNSSYVVGEGTGQQCRYQREAQSRIATLICKALRELFTRRELSSRDASRQQRDVLSARRKRRYLNLDPQPREQVGPKLFLSSIRGRNHAKIRATNPSFSETLVLSPWSKTRSK